MLLRLLRTLGFLLGALCASFVATALFLIATWDGVRLQAELVRAVREHLQRPLAMGHAPRLRFLPGPTLIFEDLALGERGAPGMPVRVGRIEAALALGPLLRGGIELTQVRILDPVIRLQRRPDGSVNLADLARLNEADPPWPLRWKLDGIALERGQIEYLDADHEQALRLERVSLASGALQSGARGRLSGAATLTHGPGAASGGAELEIGYQLDAQGYDIEYAALRFRGEALGVTGISSELSARGGRGDHGHALALHGLALRGQGRAGTDMLELIAAAEGLAGQDGALALRGFSARLKRQGQEGNLEASLEAPAIATRSAEFPGEPVTATFRSRRGKRESEGTLAARIAYRPADDRIELDAINFRWRNGTRQSPRTWNALVGGRIAFAPFFQRGEGELQASVDTSRLRLSGSYDANRDLPWLLDCSGERVDADRIATLFGRNGPAGLLAPLANLRLAAKLQASALSVGGIHTGQVSASLETGKGVVGFEAIAAQLYGGSLSGQLHYEPARKLLLLDQRAEHIQLAALAADLHRTLPLRGDLSGSWQLEAPVGRLDAALAGLAGNARLSFRNAVWQGMEFDSFLRAVRPALKDRAAAERPSLARDKQALEALSADCRFAGGKADCSNLSGGIPWIRLGGGGSVALGNGALDWILRIAVQSRGPVPREFAGLKGLTIPVRMSGAPLRPVWRLDWNNGPARPAPVRPAPAKPAPPVVPVLPEPEPTHAAG